MKFLKNKIRRWLNEDGAIGLEKCYPTASNSISSISESDVLQSKGFTFKVTPASGGIAIELYTYNSRSENRDVKLYVLPDGCELGEEIARILSLESLRT